MYYGAVSEIKKEIPDKVAQSNLPPRHIEWRNPMKRFVSTFTHWRPVLGAALVCWLVLLAIPSAQAQTLTVLHNFTGGTDGGNPVAAVTLDRAGNLYGTAHAGGLGYGTAFKLARRGQGWVFNLLYRFQSSDGAPPSSPLVFGPNGVLYGTTATCGGCGPPNGTVFTLRPPATICPAVSCPWMETVLYRFTGGMDSRTPEGPLVFDQSGNLYGTTFGIYVRGERPQGGYSNGAVWELVHSGGSWTINVLYGFMGGGDGANPSGGVIFDRAGNLYGTTTFGGERNWGTVFQLTPSGSGWSEQTLHSFQSGQEGLPQAGLIADQAGNLYGATFLGGWVFELTSSGSGWNFNNIYEVPGEPQSSLTIDGQGNLYGVNPGSGYQSGNIFELSQSNGVWTYTDLYDFTGGSDGSQPFGSVVLDASGNIYGTASEGGQYGYGTVWMLTP